MKLTASMMLTVDGVYQGPGGPNEDRSGGFDRGGWTAAYGDEEGWQILQSLFERADAFLLGRKTWEIWERLLAAPRHGRSGFPRHQRPAQVRAVDHAERPDVANTHVIDGDVEAAVRELKAKPGASSRSMAAASCSDGCSSAISWTSSTCGSTRSWWAMGCGSSRNTARRTTLNWSKRFRRSQA